MYILKGAVKDNYITMVNADVAIDLAVRSVIIPDISSRKLIAYAMSLPFWVCMPAVLDDEAFDQFRDFVAKMDQIVVPESMYTKFMAIYRH